MQCPHCSTALKLEGEFFHSDCELDGTASVTGSVTITLNCAECSEELGEYDIELEQDIENFSVDHDEDDDHELIAELDDEAFDEHVDDAGVAYPGATATIKVSCSCGSEIHYLWRNYDSPADIMKELGY